MKKRILFILVVCIISCFAIVGYARFIEPNRLKTRTIDIETQSDIKPCTIIYFTDTHFGKYFDVSHIEKIVKRINEESPDIVIFGGDLLDNYARDRELLDLQFLKEALQKIEVKTAKYAVWGNHDYGGGAVRMYEDFMTSCGFTILKNESVMLDEYGINIIGYDDYLMGWSDPALYKINSDTYNVIISHEPIISQFIESRSEAFLLSGHTHGGQVRIPFLTDKFLPEGSGQFVKGFYSSEDIHTSSALSMYTSSGIGLTRYPFRFFNVPEIIKINIH